MTKLKLCLAALGLSAAFIAGPASAAINWQTPFTIFEDDDLDFLYTPATDGSLVKDTDGIINEGDVLVAVFELNTAGGQSILPQELTGISAIQVGSINELAPGIGNITFQPYLGGLNQALALGTDNLTVVGGEAGGGAMVAMYLDDTPNLDISASNLPGALSCAGITECIDQAVDGALWQVQGFAGDPDELWETVLGAIVTDTSIPLNTIPSTELQSANAAVSILFNGTGRELLSNSIPCFPFCNPGGDGFVDVTGGGTIKGGVGLAASLIADGAFATSDFDMTMAPIPEPGSLALLAAGLLGMGVAQRRRRRKTSEV